ncbi:MAG: hypothetical protein ABL903_03115 [Methylococcales bacterium]
MKKVSMKKLSIAVLAATGILVAEMGAAEAAVSPAKIAMTVTAPTGTAGMNAAVTAEFKGLPWLPCTSAAVSFNGTATTKFDDQLQFDLAVTNTALATSTTGSYDTYVFFVNYSATGTRGTSGTASATGDIFYAVTTSPAAGFAGISLKPFMDGSTTSGDGLTDSAITPASYRFLASGGSTTFKNTLFGGPISLDAAGLPQGLWGVLAVLVDPTVIIPTDATKTPLLQNPVNWVAASFQPFVLGTPFQTAKGTTGTGLCS